VYKIFGKPKEKRPLDRLRHGWGIILNLKKWVEDVSWIHLDQVLDQQQAFVNALMNFWLP
jgi:hypothetical protein